MFQGLVGYLLLSLTWISEGDHWPAFLGAGATEVSAESLPLTWSPTENVAWKIDLPGQGQSSPVIWGEHIYVTSIEGTMKDTCHVIAINLSDGSEAWRVSLPSSQPVRSNYFQSRSAPTPACDESGVYAFFETGDLIALDHAGQERWRRSIVEDYGDIESTIGLAASPLLLKDSLILLVDHEGPSYLASFDLQTGETRWMSERDSRKSYSSPMAIEIAGSLQIVCSSDGSVDGYDPATGEQLWSFDQVGGNTSCSPLAFADGRFLIGASAGMHGEREEDARRSNIALSVEKTGDVFEAKTLWSADKAMPTFASPMVYQGYAYWVNRVGAVFCFDATTGAPIYSERVAQTCWATPVGIGDRIYFFGKDGVTSVIAAGPEFKVLAENTLWEADEDSAEETARRRAAAGNPTAGNPTAGGEGGGGNGGAGGRPAPGSEEEARMREAMAGVFAEKVQYGVAIVPGNIVIRSGSSLHCLRMQ